jgi:hypothetical protein
MDDIHIEQALWIGTNSQFRLLGRSPGFPDEWLPDAQEMCAAFGDRPTGVDCPLCVFAQPFGKRLVAVVQVADQPSQANLQSSGESIDATHHSPPTTHPTPGLVFRQMVFGRQDYPLLAGDPFGLAERFPPNWELRGDLPTLSAQPSVPARSVEKVEQVLRKPDGPALLGGVQALIDGSRLVFQRPVPDTQLMKDLWMLLPASNRCELWPASFAFDNSLHFDVVVTSRPNNQAFDGYLTEEQAADYPQGRYELNLQTAAEAGDQDELNALFSRRSRAQTWRLGWLLLAAMIVLLLVMSLVNSMARH